MIRLESPPRPPRMIPLESSIQLLDPRIQESSRSSSLEVHPPTPRMATPSPLLPPPPPPPSPSTLQTLPTVPTSQITLLQNLITRLTPATLSQSLPTIPTSQSTPIQSLPTLTTSPTTPFQSLSTMSTPQSTVLQSPSMMSIPSLHINLPTMSIPIFSSQSLPSTTSYIPARLPVVTEAQVQNFSWDHRGTKNYPRRSKITFLPVFGITKRIVYFKIPANLNVLLQLELGIGAQNENVEVGESFLFRIIPTGVLKIHSYIKTIKVILYN